MNWLLWTGVAAFCAATACTEVYLTRHGIRRRSARLGAYSDTPALAIGIATIVLVQLLTDKSGIDTVFAWTSAVFWGLGAAEIAHLVRLGRRDAARASDG
ncbi:hypothetical protein [Streptomyces sp. NPDC051162]|uniref:hypothetical protein n=1 Tax=Streptomyces sp. NPDC051162 TaxID=3154747 RepID=UPI0034394E15